MIELRLDLRNLLQLAERLRAAPERLVALEREIVQEVSFAVEAQAKRRVPRVTGRLFSSLGPAYVEGVIGHVSTNVVYARAVEFGFPSGYPIHYAQGRAVAGGGRTRPYVARSRGRAAKPYFEPGVRAAAIDAELIAKRRVDALLDWVAGQA